MGSCTSEEVRKADVDKNKYTIGSTLSLESPK